MKMKINLRGRVPCTNKGAGRRESCKKRSTDRTGFTLIEMVLVIAIIVILAVVVYFNIAAYLNRAKEATSMMNEHIEDIENATSLIAVAAQ